MRDIVRTNDTPAGPVRPVAWFVLIIGAVFGASAIPWEAGGAPLIAGALAFALLVLLGILGTRPSGGVPRRGLRRMLDADPVPRALSDLRGRLLYANPASRSHLGEGGDVAALLRGCSAEPDTIQDRMLIRVRETGGGAEDIVTARGRVRLTAQAQGSAILWRIEDIGTPEDRGAGGALPMLTTGANGTILHMNDALRRIAGRRARNLAEAFEGDPRLSDDVLLLGPDGPLRCRVHRIDTGGGRTEIYLLPASGDLPADGTEGFEDMPVALLRLGPGGHVLGANRLAREIFDEISTEGTYLSGLVEGLGRGVSEWVDDALAGRASALSEVLRVRNAPVDTFLQVTLGHGAPAGEGGLVAVLHDATELKTLEAQFVQSQKMQAIGQLAGGVAHDFNNLLTAISGHCDLLLLRHDQGDEEHADLVQIAANANRAAGLVRQLLAFSRKQTLTPETMDLRDTLADMMHLLNRLVGEKVILSLTHDPELHPIRADRRQLEQVLMNLVVNARDALPEGGEIRVETENVILPEMVRRDRAEVPPGSYVRLRVIDRGIGIPPDKLRKIFEPFYTTKRQGEGTGLGLSTAYGIVKQTGGFIFCDSQEGAGTTFTLFFPAHARVAAAPETLPAPPPARPSAPYGSGVILLVEDEAPVRAFASRALGLRGYTVIEADSGEMALDLLSDPQLSVDLFVSDVIMPGLDGPTWVQRALKDRPGISVVFMSGYAEDALDEAARIENAAFLPKPFSLSELATAVQARMA